MAAVTDGSGRWQRLQELVQAALERATDKRAVFLAEACGGDEDLRREAASLIDRDARAAAFLATPIGELAANTMSSSTGGTLQPDESRDFIGRRIGTYEIRAQGSHMVITLNGVKTAEADDAKHARGPFALQYGAGVVKFRNVQVRPL